jgi:group I intron endonuclease
VRSVLTDMSTKPYGFIYLIRNRVNGKVYVGQTIQPVNLRWNQHVCKAKHGRNLPFLNAIAKYGREAFTVLILTSADDQDTLNLKERILIRAYGSMTKGIGYNSRAGGARGALTEEHKAKIGAANAISLLGRKEDPEVTQRRGTKLRGTKRPGAASRYRGVRWESRRKRWYVEARQLTGKLKYLGSFSSEVDAAEAFDSYVIANHLDWPLNFAGVV